MGWVLPDKILVAYLQHIAIFAQYRLHIGRTVLRKYSQQWVTLPDKILAAYLQTDISEALPPNIQLAMSKIGRAQ